jgi:hypothetical protein
MVGTAHPMDFIMLNIIVENVHTIAGAILLSAWIGWIRWRNNKKSRLAEASAKFRNKVLNELEGLYPDTVNWPKDIDVKLRQTFPAIEIAVAEFRYFVPFYRKGAFDVAMKEYHNNCCAITGDTCAAYVMYPDMRKPGEQSPEKIFKDSIEALLFFARET